MVANASNGFKDTQALTQLEFEEEDFALAEEVAKRLGFTQTAYTSTSNLWGLFCLPDRPTQRHGCVIKTKELGMLYVSCLEDLLMYDLYEKENGHRELTRKRMAERKAKSKKVVANYGAVIRHRGNEHDRKPVKSVKNG